MIFRDDDNCVQKVDAPKKFTVIKYMEMNFLNQAKDEIFVRYAQKDRFEQSLIA